MKNPKDLVNGLKANPDQYPDFFQTAATRFSCRNYRGKALSPAHLDKVLRAGCMAPIARGRHSNHKMTVLLGRRAIRQVELAISELRTGRPMPFSSKNNFTYGAHTLVIVSSKDEMDDLMAMCDASCMVENMLLACSALDASGVIIWAAAEALRNKPELCREFAIPEIFKPTLCVALGYEKEMAEGLARLPKPDRLTMSTNYYRGAKKNVL